MSREVMQQALNALDEAVGYVESPTMSPSMADECRTVVYALRAALAAPSVPADWDSIALQAAREIALMWGQDRSQFVSKIQVRILDAMLAVLDPPAAPPAASRREPVDAAGYPRMAVDSGSPSGDFTAVYGFGTDGSLWGQEERAQPAKTTGASVKLSVRPDGVRICTEGSGWTFASCPIDLEVLDGRVYFWTVCPPDWHAGLKPMGMADPGGGMELWPRPDSPNSDKEV